MLSWTLTAPSWFGSVGGTECFDEASFQKSSRLPTLGYVKRPPQVTESFQNYDTIAVKGRVVL